MNSRNKIIKIALFAILVYLFYLYWKVGYSSISTGLLSRVLLLSFIGFFLYVLKKESMRVLRNQYLTISTIFLVGLIPTCFQYYFMYVNDLVPNLALGYYLDTNVVNRSAILSSIGLISYFIGNTYQYPKSVILPSEEKRKELILSGIGIQFAAIVLFVIYFITMPKDYFLGNYGNYELEARISSIPRFTQRFYNYFVIASVAVVSYMLWKSDEKVTFKNYIKHFNILFIIVLFINAILILMSGDRDNLIYTFGVFILAFVLINKVQFDLKKVVLLGVPAVLIFFVMGLLRHVDFNTSTSEKLQIAQVASENMEMAFYFAATDEFGRVIRAQHAILMHVRENGHQFLTVLYEFFGLVPGLGTLFTSILGVTQNDIGSSRIATSYMDADHGMGTTCIADLYLSMGVIGVCVFMFFLGRLYRRIETEVYTDKKLFYWVFYLTSLVYAVLIGRADMMTPFRHCFYVFLIVYVFNINNFSRRKRNRLNNNN